MKNLRYVVMFTAVLVLQVNAQAQAVKIDQVIKSDNGMHLVVKFKDPKTHQFLKSTPETTALLNSLGSTDDAQLLAAKHHVNVQPIDAATVMMPLAQATGLEIVHSRSASLGYDELAVHTDDIAATINTLMATGQFVSVEPVYKVYETALDVNDPMAKDQFYLRPYGTRFKSSSDFDALHAGFKNLLGRKVRFAVLDSGSWAHEDVQFVDGYNFVSLGMEPDRGRGVDANAKYTNKEGTSCQSGHGLAVASILAATKNNGVGIVGAFPSDQAEIVPVRVLGCAGGGTVDVMEGLLWAAGGDVTGVPKISQRVDVANMSLGSARDCSKYEQEILNEVAQLGVTVVIAAGNDNLPSEKHAPGACANAITVGALMNAGDKANISNYGQAIDVVAEGYSVYTADLNVEFKDKYANGSGTSYSAPLVAALAGAMIAQEPSLTGLQVEARLKATAIKNPSKSLNSNCRLYGCGAGLVQVPPAMGFEQPEFAKRYAVQHRYEGFATPADLAWMTALQPKATACQTLKYTMGVAGIKQSGVSYKIFVSPSGAVPSLLTEVSFPQFIHATADNSILSFQRCEKGICGELIAMNKGNIAKPKVCL
jgi:hypothetical protein